MTRTGADISHWQGNYNPASYKASGEDFIFLKATEHTSYVDSTFKARWAASKAAGLPRGAYHFARPGRSGAAAQADHFIRTLKAAGWGTRDAWTLDMEDAGGVGASGLVAWSEVFCDRVTAALGGPGLFYSYLPFIRSTMGNPGRVPGGCLAWVARYRTDDPYAAPHACPKGWPDPPDVWQCSNGTDGCVKTVASIGRCDYNRMTEGAYAKLFGSGAAPPAEEWWTSLGAAELQQIQGAFVRALGGSP